MQDSAEEKFGKFSSNTVDVFPVHVCELDSTGRIIAVNKAWREFYDLNGTGSVLSGYGIGTNYFEICLSASGENSEEASPMAEGLRLVLSGERDSFSIEYPCHSPTEQRWYEATVTRLIGERGAAIVAHRNVTERKLTQIALANSEARQREVIEAIPDCVTVMSLDGKLQAINQVGCRVFDADLKDQLIGARFLDFVTVKYRDEFNALLAMVGRGQKASLEFEIRGCKGAHLWLHMHAVPLFGSDGDDTSVLGISRDVTMRKGMEDQLIRINKDLRQARREAEQANQAKSSFISSMSHELRTPMNAVLGFGDLLQTDPTLSEEHRGYVREIIKGGNHLMSLIEGLLDLAKIESGRIDIKLQPVQVRGAIDECIALVETLAARRRVRILCNEVGDGLVLADPLRLKQVLLNLISNAIKYNHEGGAVEIDARQIERKCVRIRVSDTGLGIQPERLSEIFKPFSRHYERDADIEGTGIGLSITKRIIEAMNGTIGVASQAGEGSRFWIELPCIEKPEAQAEEIPGRSGP